MAGWHQRNGNQRTGPQRGAGTPGSNPTEGDQGGAQLGGSVITGDVVEGKLAQERARGEQVGAAPALPAEAQRGGAVEAAGGHMSGGGTGSRIDSLDGLRALAVVLVFCFHIQEVAGFQILPGLRLNELFQVGWIGVDLFFVLSGFFIGLAVLRPRVWQPWSFVGRRVRRIVPAYYGSMLILVALSGTYFVASTHGLTHLTSHLLLIHNMLPSHHGSINGVYWTLGVEWSFYLLMLVCAPLLRSPRWFWPTIGGFLALCYAWRAAVVFWGPADTWMRYFIATQLPGSLDEFVAGIVVARWSLQPGALAPRQHGGWWALGLGLGATLLFVWAVSILRQHVGDYWQQPFMSIIWRSMLSLPFAAWIVAFLLAGPGLGVWLRRAGITYIGLISYSIYLYHMPVLQAFQTNRATSDLIAGSDTLFVLLCALVVMLLSAASFHLIEARWMGR